MQIVHKKGIHRNQKCYWFTKMQVIDKISQIIHKKCKLSNKKKKKNQVIETKKKNAICSQKGSYRNQKF